MYPEDRRKVACRVYSFVGSLRATGIIIGVHFSTVSRWLKNPERKQYTKRIASKTSIIIESLMQAIRSNPFASIRQLTKQLRDALNIELSRELVRIAIKRLGLTKKKAKVFGSSKLQVEKTSEFLKLRSRYLEENRKIVAIDETSFGRNWPDVKGYSKRGTPLLLQKRKLQGKNISVLACVSRNGWVDKQKIMGSYNAESFAKFIDNLSLEPGTIVLLDNVAFHHSKVSVEAFRRKQLVPLFVPPYSPWFNPIELCFSIVKRLYYQSQDIETSFENVQSRHFEAFFDKSLGCVERF